MSKNEFIVEIKRENGTLTGKLQKVKKQENGKLDLTETLFDPTIFLIDLYKKDTNYLTADDVKNVFGFKFDKFSATHDLMFVNALHKFIADDKQLNLYDLEKFKVLFDVNVDYTIFYKLATYTTETIKGKAIKTENYMPFMYSLDIDEDVFNQELDCHKYMYKCNSITEILFAIFHYLMMNKYKIATCVHCEKKFYTNNFKTTHCKRKSPYKRYEHLECFPAVKNIKQKLKKRRDNIYSTFMTFGETEKAYNFSDEVKPYTDKVKDLPNISNLKEYEYFLYCKYGKKEKL